MIPRNLKQEDFKQGNDIICEGLINLNLDKLKQIKSIIVHKTTSEDRSNSKIEVIVNSENEAYLLVIDLINKSVKDHLLSYSNQIYQSLPNEKLRNVLAYVSVIEYNYIVVTANNQLVQYVFSKSSGSSSQKRYDLSDFSKPHFLSAGYIGNTNAKAYVTLLDKDVYWLIFLSPNNEKPLKLLRLGSQKAIQIQAFSCSNLDIIFKTRQKGKEVEWLRFSREELFNIKDSQYENIVYREMGLKFKLINDFIINENKLYIAHSTFISACDLSDKEEVKLTQCKVSHFQEKLEGNEVKIYFKNANMMKVISYEGSVFAITQSAQVYQVINKDSEQGLVLVKNKECNQLLLEVHINYKDQFVKPFITSINENGFYVIQTIGLVQNKFEVQTLKSIPQLSNSSHFLKLKLLFWDQLDHKVANRKFVMFTQLTKDQKMTQSMIVTKVSTASIMPKIFDEKNMEFPLPKKFLDVQNSNFCLIENYILMYYQDQLVKIQATASNPEISPIIKIAFKIEQAIAFDSFLYFLSGTQFYMESIQNVMKNFKRLIKSFSKKIKKSPSDSEKAMLQLDLKFLNESQQLSLFNGLNEITSFPLLHQQKMTIVTNRIIATILFGENLLIFEQAEDDISVQQWNISEQKKIGQKRFKEKQYSELRALQKIKGKKEGEGDCLLMRRNDIAYILKIKLKAHSVPSIKDISSMSDVFEVKSCFQVEFEEKKYGYTVSSDLKKVIRHDRIEKKLAIFNLVNFTETNPKNFTQKLELIEFNDTPLPKVYNIWQVSEDFNFILSTDEAEVDEVKEEEKDHEGEGEEEEESEQIQEFRQIIAPSESVPNPKSTKKFIALIKVGLQITVASEKVQNDLSRIYKQSKNCFYFISEKEICFQTPDNILVIYNVLQEKETQLFTLNQMDNKLSYLAQVIERTQKQRLLFFQNTQFFTYFKTVKKQRQLEVKMNWIDPLLKGVNTDEIANMEFESQFRVAYYYSDSKIGKSMKSIITIASSFNYYFWNLMEYIEKHGLNEKLGRNVIEQLIPIQLPNGKTFLNFISKSPDSFNSLNYLLSNFDSKSKNLLQSSLYLPIMKDGADKNIFDYYRDEIIQYKKDHNPVKTEEVMQSVKAMIEHIQEYPFNLCQIDIISLFKIYLEHSDDSNDMRILLGFLNARCKPLIALQQVNKGKFDSSEEQILALDQCVFSKQDEQLRLMMWHEEGSEQSIETKLLDINLFQLLDPNKNNLHQKLFAKLIKCSDDIILNPFIQSVVEYNWSQIQNRIYIFVLTPYIIFMIYFYLYTIYDLEAVYNLDGSIAKDSDEEELSFTYLGYFCRAIMLVFITYFIIVDGYQMKVIGVKKSHIWNGFSLMLYLLVYLGEILHGFNKYRTDLSKETSIKIDRVTRILYSFATLFMWTKFLYFFRVRKSTGYYIRMVIETFKDIVSFLFIFFSIVICFAQAFYIFLLNTKYDRQQIAIISEQEDHTFDGMFDAIIFAYLMNFGVFSYSPDYFGSYQTWICWVFFILAQISLTIVLLNFLIAIVNDTYSKIKMNNQVYMQKDILILMQENSFLFKGFFQCRNFRCQGKRVSEFRRLGWLKQLRLYEDPMNFIFIGVQKKPQEFEDRIATRVGELLNKQMHRFNALLNKKVQVIVDAMGLKKEAQ